MTTTLITSQHYLNDSIVAAKSAAKDYSVIVSPVIEIDGKQYQVVLDGHHSLAAAIADGVEPEITVATVSSHDSVALIGEPAKFLETVSHGNDWINAISGWPVW